MATVERLLKASEEIWAGYHTHPFVEGLKNGDLDREKFRHYIVQDYLYLLEYAKVFAIGVSKSRSVETMRLFAHYILAVLEGESDVHNGYMTMLGISREELSRTPAALDNRSYTAYMLNAAYQGGEAEVLTAILSCAYSYEVIARRMAEENPAAAEHPLYGRWVRGYIAQSYADNNRELMEMLERLTADYSEAQLRGLEDIFVTCSRYEGAFWDMAWERKA